MIIEASQKKADEIIARGKTDAAVAKQDASKKVNEMLNTGEPARSVAERLGLTAAALRRIRVGSGDSTAADVQSAGTNTNEATEELT